MHNIQICLVLIGCTCLLAELGIPRTQPGGDGSGYGHHLAEQRIKNYDYAFDSVLRLRRRRPAATGELGPVALFLHALDVGATGRAQRAGPAGARPLAGQGGCLSSTICLVASRRAQCGQVRG
jgi:hypothetical protein